MSILDAAQIEVRGVVVKGDGRGRGLGFPTANLALKNSPPVREGIYAAWATLDSDPAPRRAVIHAGPRPSFPGASPSFEVHVLDFPDRDLYGSTLTCTDLVYIRGIKNFSSVEELKTAIAHDCQQARRLLV